MVSNDQIAARVVRIEGKKRLGSGFLVRPKLVLTAAHVVGSDERWGEEWDVFHDGKRYDGSLAFVDSALDVALVRVSADRPLVESDWLWGELPNRLMSVD